MQLPAGTTRVVNSDLVTNSFRHVTTTTRCCRQQRLELPVVEDNFQMMSSVVADNNDLDLLVVENQSWISSVVADNNDVEQTVVEDNFRQYSAETIN